MISPDQVAEKTLRQMIGRNKSGMEDYRQTKNFVNAALFSRYPRRREYARCMLDETWRTPIGIETITENGIIYAYINFNNIARYVLVDRYREDRPVFEETPTEKEMSKWPLEQLRLPFD